MGQFEKSNRSKRWVQTTKHIACQDFPGSFPSEFNVSSNGIQSTLLNKSLSLPHSLQPSYELSNSLSFSEPNGHSTEIRLHRGRMKKRSLHLPRDGKSAMFDKDGTLQYHDKHGLSLSSVSSKIKSSLRVSSMLYPFTRASKSPWLSMKKRHRFPSIRSLQLNLETHSA